MLIGIGFAVLRRLSACELISHAIYERRNIPAYFIDYYIILSTVLIWIVFFAVSCFPPQQGIWIYGTCGILVFNAIQITQVNLHRNIWRPIVDRGKKDPRRPRKHGRNFVSAVIGYANINVLFSVAYWALRNSFSQPLGNPVQSLYFSFVTGATVGFGDIVPTSSRLSLQLLILVQIVLALLMTTVVVGATVAAISPERQQSDDIQKSLLSGFDFH